MVRKLKKAYDAEEEQIIDEDPEQIVDEDIIEEGDEDPEEIVDEDISEEEDEDPEEYAGDELPEEEITDEDLIGEEDEDIEEEDEDPEEASDEDLVGEEDEDDTDKSCQDDEILEEDPLWRRIKRVFTGSRSDAAGHVVEDAALQKAVMDELSTMLTKRIEARDSLAKQVMPLIGKFKYKSMTANQIAKYACDKLDIRVSAKDAKAALKGYLKARKSAPRAQRLYTLDSAVPASCMDRAIEEYLKGDK